MNEDINNNKYFLPPKTTNKKTLVLDLDETLVHSQFLEFSTPSDIIIKIEIEKEIYDIHVLVRPGVKEFLEKMEQYYEIVIFTASISKYADILINIIDQNESCPYRLFREHCTFINNIFVKDLEKLGRDLKDIIIVDNSPLSYSFHPNNGLPILSWFENKNDRELFNITPILIYLSKVNDVREIIPKIVIDNSISYFEVEKILKKNKFKHKNINNNNNNNINKNSMNITKENSNKNNSFNPIKNNNIYENDSKEYNININIVQNNISNINNIFDEKQNKNIKNKIIKYLNISNNSETKNMKNQKQVTEKLLKLKQKNILSNIDNPSNNKNSIKLKDNNSNNKYHKRLKTYNENFNNIKTQKEKNNKKINDINKNNKQKIKKLIQKLYIDTIKRSENSLNYKKVQNFLRKRRKKEKERISNDIKSISFKHNSNNKLKRFSYHKNRIINRSVSNKRNNSNNNRTKLTLLAEYSENEIIKKMYTLSTKTKINNNLKKKRNYNQTNLFEYKTKFRSSNNFHRSSNKVDIMNNSLNIKKHYSNNKINKKFKNFDKINTPFHRKQKSYNGDTFFTKIKKNIIKQNYFKTKRLLSKNDFLKKEIQNSNNNSNQINITSNTSDYKNKLIKRAYGNFKKINLKNIDFITKRDKKRIIQTDMKEKKIENNKTNINIHRINGMNNNENLYNLYKSLNRNEKNKNGEKTSFNNTTDNFLSCKTTFRRICHQKTISYNLNSTRNFNNNIMLSKKKIQNKFKINHLMKLKSIKRQSQKEFNTFQEDSKKIKNENDDSSLDTKFMLKNKFFDYINLTRDNFNIINRNIIKSKNRGIRTINRNNNSNKKSGIF